MRKLLAGAAIVALIASPVMAADAIVDYDPAPVAPIAPVGYDWSGFFVGAQIGYGWSETDPFDLEGDGIIGGGHIGYNHDFGNFVVGAELDYDVTDFEYLPDTSVDGVGRAKLRLGADLGRTMIYGTGGGAWAHGEILGDDVDDFGYFVGAGVNFAATDNIIIGGEYLFHQFEDVDDTGIDIDAHTFTVRASYKF